MLGGGTGMMGKAVDLVIRLHTAGIIVRTLRNNESMKCSLRVPKNTQVHVTGVSKPITLSTEAFWNFS